MASVAVTSITNIIRSVTAGLGTGLQIAGAPITAFRIAAGQAGGDTAVLAPPAEFGNIRAVFGPVGHNLPTTGVGATNITVTIPGPTTPTVAAFDVWLVGSPAS
jgi:hypothetical protein